MKRPGTKALRAMDFGMWAAGMADGPRRIALFASILEAKRQDGSLQKAGQAFDAAVDWEKAIPGKVGAVLEELDGWIGGLLAGDPRARAWRKAKRIVRWTNRRASQ